MAHRRECLCSASQLWLPHPALCVVPPECFRGLCVWSGAMGSKSGKLQNIADRDKGMNPKRPSKPVMDHSNGELCHSDFPMPQQCFSDLSTMYWRAFWMSA